jgi:hypothetical protein
MGGPLVDWDKAGPFIGRMSDKKVAELVGCSDTAVRDRRNKLNIEPFHPIKWGTPQQEEDKELFVKGQRRCSNCWTIKPIDLFNKATGDNGRDGFNRWCKDCKGEYQRNHQAEKIKHWRKEAGCKCHACGFDKYQCSLEFHHVNGDKEGDDPARTIRGNLIDNLKVREELDKCVLLCANCHTAIHRGAIALKFVKRHGLLGWTLKA